MNELISVQNTKAIDVFTVNGIDPLLQAISMEVDSFVPDLSTVTSRKDIASMANKVARSKTYLDGLGKELVSEWKGKSKAVDDSRKVMRTYLDNLKVEIRKPLTEWEMKEKDRVMMINRSMAVIDDCGFPNGDLTLLELNSNLKQLDEFVVDDSFGEYKEQANTKIQDSISHLEHLIEQRKQYEADQLELERLRKADAERKYKAEQDRFENEKIQRHKDLTEKIEREKADAAAKARHEAEEKARLEAEEKEQDRLHQIELKEQAEERAKQAERDKIAAEERAKKNQELAVQRERERVENENNRALAEQKKREEHVQHRLKIHNEAIDKLTEYCELNREEAQNVILGIASKSIPHITIQY